MGLKGQMMTDIFRKCLFLEKGIGNLRKIRLSVRFDTGMMHVFEGKKRNFAKMPERNKTERRFAKDFRWHFFLKYRRLWILNRT